MKFVIMKSGFGDYWIGITKLELPDNIKVFGSFEAAREEAMTLCDGYENRDELEYMKEDEIEDEIDEEMFKWLV